MDDLERVVAITDQETDRPIGAGLLIDTDLVITCAHVVNAALGRGRDTTRPSVPVPVRLFGAPEPVKATIDPEADGWRPPPAKDGGDLCILRLPPGTAARGRAHLREYANMWGREFRAAGYPEKWQQLGYGEGSILGRNEDKLYMLATRAHGTETPRFFLREQTPAGLIHRGFSGGPVESGGEIVGLLTMAREPKDATAYMTPVTEFGARFDRQIERYANRVCQDYQHVIELSRMANERLDQNRARLDLRLRYCADFPAVLEVHRNTGESAEEYKEGLDRRSVELAGEFRRRHELVMLHAPGGAGKSTFLSELLLAATDDNFVPFLVDFSKPTPRKNLKIDETEISTWFELYDSFGSFEEMMRALKQGMKPLLIVDAFNQISANWNDILLTLVKLWRGNLSRATIIVSDRMVVRGDVMKSFRHAVIPPLSGAAYRSALEGSAHADVAGEKPWRPLLSSPMFLDLLLGVPRGDGDVAPSRFQILNDHFRHQLGLNAADLRALADFGFETYRRNKATPIPVNNLNQLPEELKIRIQENGLIHPLQEGLVEFRHQLLHDALAALKVASATEEQETELLRGPAFDILSLNAASPDAVELAVEALTLPQEERLSERETPFQPREFLAEVFDWNYWITLQCVASFDRRGESRFPPWLRHAIYGHNLERRFDPFLHTAHRVDSLRNMIPKSLTYRDAKSRTEMAAELTKAIEAVAEPDAEIDYRQQWLDVFLRDRPFAKEDLRLMWSDPIIAWTAANAIRRFDISPEVTLDLVRIYEISRKTSDSAPKAASFRWRIVHALGRGTTDAVDLLMRVTLDTREDANVRYGAVRSLIELVVTGADKRLRDETLAKLQSQLGRLFEGKSVERVRKELRRTCAFNEPQNGAPPDWLAAWLGDGLLKFADLLEEGRGLAKDNGDDGEARIWSEWAGTAREVPRDVGKWEKRKTMWLATIEKDP